MFITLGAINFNQNRSLAAAMIPLAVPAAKLFEKKSEPCQYLKVSRSGFRVFDKGV
jgi:hypothetical protein